MKLVCLTLGLISVCVFERGIASTWTSPSGCQLHVGVCRSLWQKCGSHLLRCDMEQPQLWEVMGSQALPRKHPFYPCSVWVWLNRELLSRSSISRSMVGEDLPGEPLWAGRAGAVPGTPGSRWHGRSVSTGPIFLQGEGSWCQKTAVLSTRLWCALCMCTPARCYQISGVNNPLPDNSPY